MSQTDCAHPTTHEFRAVWVTTIGGLDWPTTFDTAQQKRSLQQIVMNLKAARFNTIFFQARGRGDAMYKSRTEPWSDQLTGTLGKDPGWDPLAFIIREAHEQGMEVHAWFNAFLTRTGKSKPPESNPQHIILRHPEWFHLIENEWWLDPGIPAVRNYLVEIGMEIVRRYDIDGIHFDFIRYPGKPFPDESTYKRYGKKLSKEDWRRENINQFVRSFYDSATAVKPMLKIGSAPIGIYTNLPRASGLQGYYELFQDSREWLREGKHDYVAPQVYWQLGGKSGNPDFGLLARDWSTHSFGRHVYLGIGAYKPEVHEQIPELIDTSRCAGAAGNSFFRYEHIANMLEVGMRYRYPANIPPMPWKDSIPPNPPQNLVVRSSTGGIFNLQWDKPTRAVDGDYARYYNIYRSSRSPVNVLAPENLLTITTSAATMYSDTIVHPAAAQYYYAVSSFDKGNNESAPTRERAALIPEIAELAKRYELEFKLGEQYPGSANGIVFIPYEIKRQSPVLLKILDMANNEVMNIVDSVQEAGRYIAATNVSNLKKGNYTCLLVAGEYSQKRDFIVGN